MCCAGVIAVETQTVMLNIPADPGMPDSMERTIPQVPFLAVCLNHVPFLAVFWTQIPFLALFSTPGTLPC